MALQNRVDPFGAIRATEARGLFTGNRGVIHDPATKGLLARRWTTKAWIICTLEHPRGVRREPMGRNGPGGGTGWTELFFVDEVTALAAGHRPCFYCRREAASRFSLGFGDAFGIASPKAPEIDAKLHIERVAAGGQSKALTQGEVRSLPDGAMIAFGDRAFAIRGGAALPWTFSGYDEQPPACRPPPPGARLITPPTTVAVLRAGYRPVWHPSAGHVA